MSRHHRGSEVRAADTAAIEAPRRKGAMLVFIAVLMVLFFITVALAIDISYMQLVRTELRTATDSAARAGAEALSRLQDVQLARQAAKDAAAQNLVGGKAFAIYDSDIIFGASALQSDGRFSFSPGGTPPSACRVTGRKTSDSAAGSVSLFFGGALGTPFFQPSETATASQLDRDICLVLDRSGSMAWRLNSDTYPSGRSECTLAHPTLSRWGQLQLAVDVFLGEINNTLQQEQVGLVTFSSAYSRCSTSVPRSEIDSPLSSDYTPVSTALARRSNSRPIIGGTSISSGIDDGVKVLTDKRRARPYALKTLIVLTDGVHNDGRSPILSAEDAAKLGVMVHTITYSIGADQRQMQAVATAGGGKSFHAPDAATLRSIFREIALTVPVLLTE